MTKARSNATANAAKGDLTVGNGTNLSGVLGVGSNGETIVADSSTSTGLRYQGNYAAGKNVILNSDFRISQRGTTFTNPVVLTYQLDRWSTYFDGTGATRTISQQTFTPGTAPVAGYEGTNFYRYAISAAGSSNTANLALQKIEDVRTFAGQTATISFWAKADSARQINTYLFQNFGSGGSSGVNTQIGSGYNLTTSWQRYSATVTLPSISGKTIGTSSFLELDFYLPNGTTFTVDIWGVQLEAGSVATAFQTATGTIQGELAACQRYYYRNAYNGTGTGNYLILGDGQATSTTGANIIIDFPVTMRNEPQSVDFAGLIYGDWNATIAPAITSMSIFVSRRSANLCILQTVGTSANLTAGSNYYLMGNGSGTSYVGLSAEL